ncbi:MAG: 3-phosphoshikimate 1-carboxyvinyltransferase, partial [Bacillota bacterium]|nr:3-phosphoshikimate 1-carboxyvinyltransferase [Bacillota bacterium]
EEFGRLGANITPTEDGFSITGEQSLRGGTADSRGDHRIAMALSIAALRTANPVTVRSHQSVAISYPTFWTTLQNLGSDLTFPT